MYRRNDPRLRRTLNEITHTLENANQTAQTQVFVFGQDYVSPCLSSIRSCFQPCVGRCMPPRDQRARGRRRSNGRAELNFDFYDDWDDDEDDALLGWGDEEYQGFGAGHASYGGTSTSQPSQQPGMAYAARREGKSADTSGQGSSYLDIFKALKDKFGGSKALRYKPSAAGLQEHPAAGSRFMDEENEPLMTDESDGGATGRRHRKRSGTTGSEQTVDTLSSRGDLFRSDDEDDAIPLDDEFAMVLERRTTNSGQDDSSSAAGGRSARPSLGSRKSTRTRSNKSLPASKRSSRAASHGSPTRPEYIDPDTFVIPSLNELKQEEESVRQAEERAILKRREAAQRLAAEKGLSDPAIAKSEAPAAAAAASSTRVSSAEPSGNGEFGDFHQSSPPTPTSTSHDEDMKAPFSPALLPKFS